MHPSCSKEGLTQAPMYTPMQCLDLLCSCMIGGYELRPGCLQVIAGAAQLLAQLLTAHFANSQGILQSEVGQPPCKAVALCELIQAA